MRILAFLLGCIGLRLGLVFAAATWLPTAPPAAQWASALGALAISGSWVYLYRYNARPTGLEAGGKIWWNHLRPLHASLYAAFAVLALTQPQYAYIPLLLDVVIGFTAWIKNKLA
jgi:hypothetical protein